MPKTCCSQAVTHPSTGQAQRYLTSVIGTRTEAEQQLFFFKFKIFFFFYRDSAQGVVQCHVQFLWVWASAPDRCTVLGGGDGQSLGGDVKGLRCGSPGGSGEAAYQRDWDVVFPDIFSRCCQKVRVRSSFTPRHVGVALNCSGLPSIMTLSSRLASRLLRWNEEDIVFATLSFRYQFLR